MDEIVHGVPAKFIQNSDAGLLALLSPNHDLIFSGDNSGDNLNLSCDYMKMEDPKEKKRSITRTLLGGEFEKGDSFDSNSALPDRERGQDGVYNVDDDGGRMILLPFQTFH